MGVDKLKPLFLKLTPFVKPGIHTPPAKPDMHTLAKPIITPLFLVLFLHVKQSKQNLNIFCSFISHPSSIVYSLDRSAPSRVM